MNHEFCKKYKKCLKILLKVITVVELEILIFNFPYSSYSSKELKKNECRKRLSKREIKYGKVYKTMFRRKN